MENFPYSVLLALTTAIVSFMVLYNLVLEQEHATTLRYAYPEVEQASGSKAEVSDPMRISPEVGVLPEQAQQPQPEMAEPESAAVTSVQFPLDINTATAEQLKFIPRIGDVMSQRIVQYRDVLGGYTNLEQLMEIKGIAQATYEHLYPYLYVGQQSGDVGEEAMVPAK